MTENNVLKEDVMAVVEKYGMKEYLDNEITRQQIGWYIMTEDLLPDLDALMEKADAASAFVPQYVAVRRELLATEYRYTIVVPDTWIE